MQYLVGKDSFTKINETKGTIQNASKITTIEVSNAPVPGSGILLSPTSKFTFEIDGVYVRCVDGAGAEVRVVPFEVAGEGGGGGVGTIILDGTEFRIATNAEIAAMLDDNFGMED